MDVSGALRAYTEVALTARSPRELEAEALAKANRLLKAGQDSLPAFGPYAEALRFNQSLWDVIQRDLLAEDNPLPDAVRSNLLNLSRFVDQQTTLALSQPAAERVAGLINLNAQLLAGLSPGA